MTIKEIGKKRGRAGSSATAAKKLFKEPIQHNEADRRMICLVRIAFCNNDTFLDVETRVVPNLTNNNYHVTPHGWVFISEPGTLLTRLWNPNSGETIDLPRMEQPLPVNWTCYLSDEPTAASCIVLLLVVSEPRLIYCHVGAGDGNKWTSHEYDIGNVGLPPEYAPPQRRSIAETAALGILEFTPVPEISYIDYPKIKFPSGECNGGRSFLVASHGELYDVSVFYRGFTQEIHSLRVNRIDMSGDSPVFRRVDDLGDRAFLLSDSNVGLLCSASSYGVKGNRVYFMDNPLSKPDGGSLCIYDLEDETMVMEELRPCPGVPVLGDARRDMRCVSGSILNDK
uniref:KIB1-4 beta-propeller domain-containing protein n=1 Tax=Leersia perrieri TaxID=77586 RepID=A0A0D9V8Q5_9ORYZ